MPTTCTGSIASHSSGTCEAVPPADLSSGIDPAKEHVLLDPADVPSFSENLLFALYDAEHDLGLWLHLGTWPTDWGIWEDRVLVSLPDGGGVITSRSYLRTPTDRRPGAANLTATCVEPFVRWRVGYDGFGVRTPYELMASQVVQDGPQEYVGMEIDITSRTPVWDLHAASAQRTGQGSMRRQSWATEHYEQVYEAEGTVRLTSGELDFRGTGWRDHSRGPRGAGTGAPWGGHVIAGAYLPASQRALGLCRYYLPDGGVSLEAGYVVADGVLHHAEVLDAPRLTTWRTRGEPLHLALRSPLGPTEIDALTTTSMHTMLRSARQYYGTDPTGALGMPYAISFARWEWDGEPAILYLERSDPLAMAAITSARDPAAHGTG